MIINVIIVCMNKDMGLDERENLRKYTKSDSLTGARNKRTKSFLLPLYTPPPCSCDGSPCAAAASIYNYYQGLDTDSSSYQVWMTAGAEMSLRFASSPGLAIYAAFLRHMRAELCFRFSAAGCKLAKVAAVAVCTRHSPFFTLVPE